MTRHAAETRKVVTCRMKPSVRAALDIAADRERRSASELMEIAVEQMLTRMGINFEQAEVKPAKPKKSAAK